MRFRTQWFSFDQSGRMSAASNGVDDITPHAFGNKPWPMARNWATSFGTPSR